jgi:hypothetical protein
MVGFTPLSSATLAESQSDPIRYTLAADAILTGNPALEAVVFTEGENFATAGILSGTPDLATASLTQAQTLAASGFITGTPDLATASLVEAYSFTANSITTGAAEVNSATLSLPQSLSADGFVLGSPVLGTTELTTKRTSSQRQQAGNWQRRTFEVPDGRLVQGEREIYNLFGDVVSIDLKSKSLIKFGKSGDLAADTLETVWTVGGHEVYVTDNTITHISSSSASDNQAIFIEGHTVTGTGANSQFTFLTQVATLNGQTPVGLNIPLARISHIYNNGSTELQGRVVVYENTTTVGGIPSDATKIHIDIPQGLQGSLKGATTFSDEDYLILTGGFGSVSKKQDAAVDFYLEVRKAGGVFVQQAAVSASSGSSWEVELDPAVIIPRNADVRITAETASNGAVVFGVFKGYIAKVI